MALNELKAPKCLSTQGIVRGPRGEPVSHKHAWQGSPLPLNCAATQTYIRGEAKAELGRNSGTPVSQSGDGVTPVSQSVSLACARFSRSCKGPPTTVES